MGRSLERGIQTRRGSGAAKRSRVPGFSPRGRSKRRGRRGKQRTPKFGRVVVTLMLVLLTALAGNWIYQVVRKPSELFFPVSGSLNKTPAETWADYAPWFEEYSTRVMTPSFLAAVAQAEGSGNPLVRTYWRWSWTLHPLRLYRPASSAVGMYQITDGTYAEASRYCVQNHRVVDAGTANTHSCWQDGYTRLLPSRLLPSRILPARAVELTAAYLDHNVVSILARHPHLAVSASLPQRQALAAVIHLCGAGAGDAYARQGLKLTPGQRCGDHDVHGYLARIALLRNEFSLLAAAHATAAHSGADALPDVDGFAASVRPTSSIADRT